VTLDLGARSCQAFGSGIDGLAPIGGGMAKLPASTIPISPFLSPKNRGLKLGRVAGNQSTWWSGAPAGKTKTTWWTSRARLPLDAKRLRLSTAFEIHWDRAALFEKIETRFDKNYDRFARVGNLHRRGFSDFEPLPCNRPLTPRRNQSTRMQIGESPQRLVYAATGDVGELIAGTDNALACSMVETS